MRKKEKKAHRETSQEPPKGKVLDMTQRSAWASPGKWERAKPLWKEVRKVSDMPKYGLEVKDILAIINMLEELKTKIQQSARIDEIQEQIENLKNIKL